MYQERDGFSPSELICVDSQSRVEARNVVSWKSFIFSFDFRRKANDKEKQMWLEQISKFFALILQPPSQDYVSNHCQMCVENFLLHHREKFRARTFAVALFWAREKVELEKSKLKVYNEFSAES